MTIQSLKWPYEAEIWHISLFLTKELTAEAGSLCDYLKKNKNVLEILWLPK